MNCTSCSTAPRRRAGLFKVLTVLVVVSVGPVVYAQSSDAKILADAKKALSNKRFSDVQLDVSGGVLKATGSVGLLADKIEADKKLKKSKDAKSVDNEIQVQPGENISDQDLFNKLAKALTYDRVGYQTTAFNSIGLQVHNGVVTLEGTVYGPPDKDSAISLVTTTKGVTGLVDNLQVAPPSPMDDRIRMAEYRAIYGATQLNRYAIDPAKPIRITVVNGHVKLTGMVDNQGDKDVAGIKANGVPGVFSVENDLMVANQKPEK
jgi:hyperosmotically inducible periplasmic protein